MHPLKQLRKILNIESQQQGTVVQKNNDSIIVATQFGSKSLRMQPNDKTSYVTGDVVVLNNNTVVGKRINKTTIYVI